LTRDRVDLLHRTLDQLRHPDYPVWVFFNDMNNAVPQIEGVAKHIQAEEELGPAAAMNRMVDIAGSAGYQYAWIVTDDCLGLWPNMGEDMACAAVIRWAKVLAVSPMVRKGNPHLSMAPGHRAPPVPPLDRVEYFDSPCPLWCVQEFQEIGGFDEQFWNWGADIDLNLRMDAKPAHYYSCFVDVRFTVDHDQQNGTIQQSESCKRLNEGWQAKLRAKYPDRNIPMLDYRT
jgi:GT2 family glycosyltransferase